jgi:hypothetical protein
VSMLCGRLAVRHRAEYPACNTPCGRRMRLCTSTTSEAARSCADSSCMVDDFSQRCRVNHDQTELPANWSRRAPTPPTCAMRVNHVIQPCAHARA